MNIQNIVNVQNIDKAIAVMKRAAEHQENFNMTSWQKPYVEKVEKISEGELPTKKEYISADFVQTETELHNRGNTACFAGYLALSPEWKADGGIVDDGHPGMYFENNRVFLTCIGAIRRWLGIDRKTALCLVIGDDEMDVDDIMSNFSPYYNKPFSEVTPQDVIAKLEIIKKIGLIEQEFIDW